MGKILVVGGAGYIGSHMVQMLGQAGRKTVVLDDFSTGFRDAVGHGEVIEGSIGDSAILDHLFASHDISAVMHFASFIQVGESVQVPGKYYQNNLSNTLNLLDAMVRHGIGQFIFSSTAAIFGEPTYTPIDEKHPKQPINPYGRTKWMVEQALADYAAAYGLRSVCLRYFNAAGADRQTRIGERHDPETHLIPLVCQAASGRRDSIKIFGTDYETPDGTCVRDYIHVEDLCDAHMLALDYLAEGNASAQFNLGNGNGFSVREVIDAVQRVTASNFAVEEETRRAGDPAVLVADSSKARKVLKWQPRHAALDTIVEDAWKWELQYPWGS